MLVKYKNRCLNPNKPVKVYKNLHNGMFSIQQEGKIIGHAKNVCLKNVSFKVSETGRQRVIKEKQKNVHAFVIGEVVDFIQTDHLNGRQISYNPYKQGFFYFKDNNTEASLHPEQMLYMNTEKIVIHA
ncbi:hypothetical protein A9299_09900 [Moraxella osloensis]|uniref:Uncharacterized protein n=1 Tax=Faucicola osloensis TaxID=34062 RepID=A0AA91FQH9_FAUOS|nr:hypothetical protein [Moraxella osloensis]OBX64310.1 hypothetical protein A9299_09900 [Moraxella osloensis]